MNIEKHRKTIDSLNLKILDLVNKRAFIAIQIGKEKNKNSQPITDSKREEKIFKTLKENNQGPLSAEAVEKIFKVIIKESKTLEFLSTK